MLSVYENIVLEKYYRKYNKYICHLKCIFDTLSRRKKNGLTAFVKKKKKKCYVCVF